MSSFLHLRLKNSSSLLLQVLRTELMLFFFFFFLPSEKWMREFVSFPLKAMPFIVLFFFTILCYSRVLLGPLLILPVSLFDAWTCLSFFQLLSHPFPFVVEEEEDTGVTHTVTFLLPLFYFSSTLFFSSSSLSPLFVFACTPFKCLS